MELLFSPFQLGEIQLPNRIVMAPMTRGRAQPDGIPSPMMIDYYRLRASAGLLITEATAVNRHGVGWVQAPRIYSPSHRDGWQKITSAVHTAGGRIFLQLWHMGRVSHPDFLDGDTPVAPSAIAADGESRTPNGKKPYVVPRELSVQEIATTVEDYARAAKLAVDAGFDGVEIHSANGYLIDQFLRDGSNRRADQYGGSSHNRMRFLLEIAEAVTDAIGAKRVGVRLSPRNPYNSMIDSAPEVLFPAVARELSRFNLAYLHSMEPVAGHPSAVPGARISPLMKREFNGPFMINGGLTAVSGEEALRENQADLVAFGVPFIANPDLVRRFREGRELNAPDVSTFYSHGPEGYSDYPLLSD